MNKKNLILGGVLILLIILAYFYQGPLIKWQNNLAKSKNILAKINVVNVDKIEITSGSETTVLSRPGDVSAGSALPKWKYNNTKDFYVDSSLMAKALEGLSQAAASEIELISNNRERKNEFKFDNSGLTIKIYQAGKKIVDFMVGSQASLNGSYISTAESSATYLIKVNLLDAFKQSEWRDLTVFSTAKEKINKIRFQYPNREFTLELKDNKWAGILPEKFSVNQEKVSKIIEIMSSLEAQEIPEQTFNNTGLEKHLIIIEAQGDGLNNILMIGQNKGDLYYAKRGDSDNIYLLEKSIRNELDKTIWQLR